MRDGFKPKGVSVPQKRRATLTFNQSWNSLFDFHKILESETYFPFDETTMLWVVLGCLISFLLFQTFVKPLFDKICFNVCAPPRKVLQALSQALEDSPWILSSWVVSEDIIW